MKAMKIEWVLNGTEEDMTNWMYVVDCITCSPEWVPKHVKGSKNVAEFKFDMGHERWTLEQFFGLASKASSRTVEAGRGCRASVQQQFVRPFQQEYG